jgi:hypothetical protein
MASYYDAMKRDPYAQLYEKRYQSDPDKPDEYGYNAVTIFAADWKATRKSYYAELALRATRAFCKYFDTETNSGPTDGKYRLDLCANFNLAMITLAGTPQHDQMVALLGASLGHRADAFPIYPKRGAYNTTIMPAHWYELALKLKPDLHNASQLRAYIEDIWNSWWPLRDIDEDSSHYTTDIDLLVLDSWCRLRGVDWWRDTDGRNLWRHYCESITNDGTLPAYGDGGVHGYYFKAVRFAELTAARTRDGRYKWLAHRAFWNGRDRIKKLEQGIGPTCSLELALAYQVADDTVTEVPPKPGLFITRRRFREKTDWTVPKFVGPYFLLHDWAPSKIIFRSGSTHEDHYMMVQAANQAGHGHPDSGVISHYSGNWSYFLCYGAGRLDYYMEHYNVLMLQDPSVSVPEQAGHTLRLVSEGTSVPVSGSAPDASYARVHIQEYPGVIPTDEAWQKIRKLRSGYAPPRAIGYKNWPARLDRCVLFVNNSYALVRDRVQFSLNVTATVGQNWTMDQMDPPGLNWANIRIPLLYGSLATKPPLAPIEGGAGELLIWMVPDGVNKLQVVKGPRNSWYSPKNPEYINLPNRVWSPRSGNWTKGQELAFATLLLPHAPADRAAQLAASIKSLRHDNEATVIQVGNAGSSRILAINNGNSEVSVGPFGVKAEAAVLTVVNRQPARLSAWRATRVVLHNSTLLDVATPTDISITNFGPKPPGDH